MAGQWSLSRVLLWSVIVALSVSGLLGIGVFLFAEFGDLSAKILGTTLGVSFYSLMALGCAAALERRRAKVVALPGLAVCAVGFVYLLLFIWFELFDYSDDWWKGVPILAIFAVSFAQACLLSFVRLKHKLVWLGWTAHTAIFWLATLIAVMIVLESDDEWLIRAAGVLAIVDGCASLTIPILAKLGNVEQVTRRSPHSHIEITCPGCGLQKSYPVGHVKCTQCGLRLRLEVFGPTVPIEDPPFQFTVRSLLMLTFIVAAGLGFLSMRIGGIVTQWGIARSLETVGGNPYFSSGNVYGIGFSGPEFSAFTNEHVEMLAQLPELNTMDFRNVTIADGIMRRLARLEINQISFDEVRLPEHGLAHVRDMPALWGLAITKTPVAERDIAALNGCRVRNLTLRETGLTDKGLARLKRWPKLSELHLGEPKITKAGLMRLKDVSTLKNLYLEIAKGDKVGKEVEKELRAALPNVNIHIQDR